MAFSDNHLNATSPGLPTHEPNFEDVSIPAMAKPINTITNYINQPLKEPPYCIPVSSNAPGDSLPIYISDPIGSPLSDPLLEQGPVVAFLEGHRCHWAVCGKEFGTLTETENVVLSLTQNAETIFVITAQIRRGAHGQDAPEPRSPRLLLSKPHPYPG